MNVKYFIESEEYAIGTGTVFVETGSVILPKKAKRLVTIDYYAIAQKTIKPVSIYPVEFRIESTDLEFGVLSGIVVPVYRVVMDLKTGTPCSFGGLITHCRIYVNIDVCGGEQLKFYAKPLFNHVVGPIVSYVLIGELSGE